MHHYARLLRITLPVLFLLQGLSACGGDVVVDDGAPAPGQPIFASVGETETPEKPTNVERAYAMKLDRARLILIQAPGRVAHFIRMPDGRVLDYQVAEVEGDPPRVWRGRLYLDEDSVSSLTLSRAGERLTGSFGLGGERFVLKADGAGQVLLLKLDDTVPPPPAEPIVPDEGTR